MLMMSGEAPAQVTAGRWPWPVAELFDEKLGQLLGTVRVEVSRGGVVLRREERREVGCEFDFEVEGELNATIEARRTKGRGWIVGELATANVNFFRKHAGRSVPTLNARVDSVSEATAS
jgi:hypothetical protein